MTTIKLTKTEAILVRLLNGELEIERAGIEIDNITKQAVEEERERILENIQPAISDIFASASVLGNRHKMYASEKEIQEDLIFISRIINGKSKSDLLKKEVGV